MAPLLLGAPPPQSITISSYRHAYRWTAAAGMQDLGTLGGAESFAPRCECGRVYRCWICRYWGGDTHAFRWTAAEGMQDLGTFGGDESYARGVSADGSVIVGWAETPSGIDRAFRWTATRGMEDLGTLGGAKSFCVWRKCRRLDYCRSGPRRNRRYTRGSVGGGMNDSEFSCGLYSSKDAGERGPHGRGVLSVVFAQVARGRARV